jgi:fatty-acyl-CoA synthase
LAGALKSLGIGKGDRVAVLCPNTRVLLEATFGVPMAGAVLVAMNTRCSLGIYSALLSNGSELRTGGDSFRSSLMQASNAYAR